MEVGPSAAPMIPIEAASFKSTAPTPAQEGWGASHQYYKISVDRDNAKKIPN